MNIDEIPTPESDAAYKQWLFESGKSHRIRMGQTMKSLERRLALLTEHVGLCHDEIGESRDSDTSELYLFFRKEVANDKRRIIDAVNIIDLGRRLTIAREALDRISIWSTENSVLDVARITLTQTAPKP